KVVLQALVPNNPAMLLGSSTRRSISVATNSAGRVKTYGLGTSIDYLLPKNFLITANISSDRIDGVEEGFISFFNVPSYRLMVGFGNSGFGNLKRFGFNV